jgi:hypothetical protein
MTLNIGSRGSAPHRSYYDERHGERSSYVIPMHVHSISPDIFEPIHTKGITMMIGCEIDCVQVCGFIAKGGSEVNVGAGDSDAQDFLMIFRG